MKAIAGKLQLVESGNKAVGKALGITIQTRPDSVGYLGCRQHAAIDGEETAVVG